MTPRQPALRGGLRRAIPAPHGEQRMDTKSRELLQNTLDELDSLIDALCDPHDVRVTMQSIKGVLEDVTKPIQEALDADQEA